MNKQQTRQSKLTGQRISCISLSYFSLLLILATLAFYYDAWAFRRQSAPDPERIIAELHEKLELTDAQVDQIRPIIENQMEKLKKIIEKYSSQSRQGKRASKEEMRALKTETDSQITNLLTEEQIVKYQSLQEEQYQKRRNIGKMKGKGGCGKNFF